jgi:hypothetical protein
MGLSEFWWLMRHDTEARNDFMRNVAPPFAALFLLLAVIVLCGPH